MSGCSSSKPACAYLAVHADGEHLLLDEDGLLKVFEVISASFVDRLGIEIKPCCDYLVAVSIQEKTRG